MAHERFPPNRSKTMLMARDQNMLRYSLIFVWLATALVSVLELHGQSAQLLTGITGLDPASASLLILSGAGVDAALGLALWLKPNKGIYLAALAAMLLMTFVATVLSPWLWLHPLGPLTKNVPIAAVLLVLARKNP